MSYNRYERSRVSQGSVMRTKKAAWPRRADMLFRAGGNDLAFRFKCLLPVVVAVILSACATENINSSSASTLSTQATISADSKMWAFSFLPGSFIAVTINSVDGLKVGSGTSKVSVDPGAHKISVTCHAVGAENTEEITVNVFAGAHYQLSALVGGNTSVPCTSIVQRKSKS
jgi:hypothetical protein